MDFIRFSLIRSYQRKTKIFEGKEDTLQPRMHTKSSTSLTLLIGTSSDLAKLIFKPETTSKHKNKQCK
jgi:hypothetical protein